MLFTPAQIKPKSFESRWIFCFVLPGVDTSHFYMGAWALGSFYIHSSTHTPSTPLSFTFLSPRKDVVNQCLEFKYPHLSEGADRVAGQLRGDKECPFSGVTKPGRVWRKVPESDARSVAETVT